MGGMDPELSAAIKALADLDRDGALARLEVAAGGSEEDAAKIMRDEGKASHQQTERRSL